MWVHTHRNIKLVTKMVTVYLMQLFLDGGIMSDFFNSFGVTIFSRFSIMTTYFLWNKLKVFSNVP